MTDRKFHAATFLKQRGWGAAICRPLADDASFRRYERLTSGKHSAVLMDAPPEFEDVRPFIAIARHLKERGLCAPEILARHIEKGFLLLEDMGDDLFAKILHHDPAQETTLYELAVSGLIKLHESPVPRILPAGDGINHSLPHYDMALLLEELSLFTDWYMPARTGKILPEKDREMFAALWQDILLPVTRDLNCLVLRDYHAENLMLRTGQTGLAQLGLLDFQDAAIGHKAYDLVSLLQDARREVSEEMEQAMINKYVSETAIDTSTFKRDYAILGAQRNAKIIGIFTRLYLRDGKAAYLDKIPAVWRLLDRDLQHPALTPIRRWLDEHISPKNRPREFLPKAFMPAQAMILAAGLGKRMQPLSDHCPKPLIKVAGKELLSWSLDALCAAGVRDIVINMHYLADQMIDFAGKYYDHRLTLTLSDERTQLLDSGGGVKNALKYLGDDPFFVLNSDMIWQDANGQRFHNQMFHNQMFHKMQAFWRTGDMDILMILVPRAKAFGYEGAGDFHRDATGRLSSRFSGPSLSGSSLSGSSLSGPSLSNPPLSNQDPDAGADYVYGGIMIIKPDCFKNSPDGPFSLRQQFDQAEKAGRLFGIIHDGAWYHVGTPEARDNVEDIINKCQGG